MSKLLATIGFLLLVSALVLLILALTAFGPSQIPLTLLCGLIPFLSFLGLLLLGVGIGFKDKPPPGIARL